MFRIKLSALSIDVFFAEHFEICVFSVPKTAMAKTLNNKRRRHQKSKTGVSVASQKGLLSSKFFF